MAVARNPSRNYPLDVTKLKEMEMSDYLLPRIMETSEKFREEFLKMIQFSHLQVKSVSLDREKSKIEVELSLMDFPVKSDNFRKLKIRLKETVRIVIEGDLAYIPVDEDKQQKGGIVGLLGLAEELPSKENVTPA